MTRPVLVLGPSLGTTSATLWGACADLLRDDLDVVLWDLPGHGGAPLAGPSSTMADLAAQVLDRVDGPFAYAGDSVGGCTGLQLLLDAPDRIRSAVLLCTGARIGTAQTWADRVEQVRSGGTAALVAATPARWFGPGFADRDPDRAEALLRDLAAVDDAGYTAVCDALAGFDVRDRLPEIAAPVLAVAGADDPVTTPELLREIADGVQHGRLVVLDGVAHLAPAEAPQQVAELVRRHVLDAA